MGEIASIKTPNFILTEARAMAWELLREGRPEDARVVVEDAIRALSGDDINELVACRYLLTVIERDTRNFHGALHIHLETYPLLQLCDYDVLREQMSNGLGITYMELAARDGRRDYLGLALVEYEAARHYAQEAGRASDVGIAENNIAMVFCALGRKDEAHEHVSRARECFRGQEIMLAQVDETEARIFLQEENPRAALNLMLGACQIFLRRGEEKLLRNATPTLMKAVADYNVAKDREG